MTTPVATSDQGLAHRIRTATAKAHRAAESSTFIDDLMGGRLPIVDYARLLAQLHAIYAPLEAAVAANIDPQTTPFLAQELNRLPALEADLTFLSGTDWASRLSILPATTAYADRIRSAAATWPGGLLAHHYIRYLGDLSGGQTIRRALDRHYGLTDGRGTAFYLFPGIDSPREFKARYRQLLDDLPWGEEEVRRLIEEVSLAFRHHGEIFRELDATR